MLETALSAGRAEEAPAARRRFAATIILGHALKHVYISALSTQLMPEVKAGLSLTNAQLGTLASVQQFTGWGSTVASGYLGDRFTNKTALLLGLSLGIMGVSYFVLGVAGSYTVLLGAMLFVGLGPSIYHPPALGALARRFAERRALLISLHGAGGSLGEATGPLLAGALLAFLAWRDLLQVSMLPALAAALLMWTLLRGDGSTAQAGAGSFRAYLSAFRVVLSSRVLLLVCLATGLRSVGQTTTSTFLPVYLKDDLGYSTEVKGLFLALAQVAGISSQPLMGHLTDRFGPKRVLVPALSAMAALLFLVPLAEGQVQLALVILALGAFLFSLHAILLATAAELVSEEMQATAVSLIYASSFIGALAPTVAGLLADAQGLRATFFFSAAMVALAAAVIFLTRLPSRRRRPLRLAGG